MTIESRQQTREDTARIEAGRTDVSPHTAFFLAAMFLVTAFAAPVWQTLVELERWPGTVPENLDVRRLLPEIDVDRGAGPFQRMRTANAEMLEAIAGYEDYLDEENVLVESVVPPVATVTAGVLRAGSEEVYPGRNKWLFYRPGIDYLTAPGFLDPGVLAARTRSGSEWQPPPQPGPIAALAEFAGSLSARGIELVIVPAPAKAMLEPSAYSVSYAGHETVLQNPSYREFLRRAEAAGVHVFDPAPTLARLRAVTDKPVFLRTDTHWTPEAVQTTAVALAEYLVDQALIDSTPRAHYLTGDPVSVSNEGDIAAMLNVADRVFGHETVTVRPVTEADGTPWTPDRDSEMLLLGDSYANIYSLGALGWGEDAGFAEHLSAALRQPVDAIRINDHGAHATRQALNNELARGVDRLVGKRVVIWEFAIRELAIGDWKTGYSMEPAVRTTRRPKIESGTKISGRIVEVTRPPRPGSVPYRDCVVALRLTGLNQDNGAAPASDIVVFQWGMRDNVWTPAAAYEEGQRLDLLLTRWEDVENEYGGYTRIELASEDSMHLDAYWARLPDSQAAVQARTDPPSLDTDPEVEAASGEAPRLNPLRDLVARLHADNQLVLRGGDDWLFFTPELRHLSLGPFWGQDAVNVSRAVNPDVADPLPAILDFNEQLRSNDIRLILVPVPPKAVIYPDKVPGIENTSELGATLHEFYGVLRENGVEVLDLTEEFAASRGAGTDVFCKQDTHWNGHGIAIAAEAIASRLNVDVLTDVRQTLTARTRSIEITGDLWTYLEDPELPKERLDLEFVLDEDGDIAEPSRDSSVLLLGDSHALVFHAGADMHARGAGLPGHLTRNLGFPVDLVAVRGSAATPARMSLVRRRDNLAGKRVVVWCFTAREFTEAPGGWRKLPVIAPPEGPA